MMPIGPSAGSTRRLVVLIVAVTIGVLAIVNAVLGTPDTSRESYAAGWAWIATRQPAGDVSPELRSDTAAVASCTAYGRDGFADRDRAGVGIDPVDPDAWAAGCEDAAERTHLVP